MAAIRLTRTLRALTHSTGLSGPQISIMATVVHAERIAARDLALLEEVTSATISRQVTELESMGLLARRRDERDTRVQWITATARGKRLITEAHRLRLEPLARAMAGLSSEQRQVLEASAQLTLKLVEQMKADRR